MIQLFVDRFIAAERIIRDELKAKRPDSYDDLVTRVVQAITTDGPYDDDEPDPERITVIDHGDYQGTRLYIVPRRATSRTYIGLSSSAMEVAPAVTASKRHAATKTRYRTPRLTTIGR